MPERRTDADYEIESLSKGLAVLEILVDSEPVSQKRLVEKSKFGRDVVMRTLKTLRLRGYATQNAAGDWIAGPRLIRLATDLSRKV